MASMYPTVKPWDFTFLRYLDVKDPPKNNLPEILDNNSILSFIQNNPDFYIFNELIKIAGLEDFMKNQKNITFLLPKDSFISSSINLIKIDKLQAKKIVLLSIIPEKLYQKDLITGLFDTKVKPYQLWFQNGIVNRKSKIIYYNIMRDDGVIHILDSFPFSF